MLKAGDAAPDFTLTTHEGKPLTLSSLRGRKVLLWFYPMADTPGCTAEGRGFRDQQNYFDENNIQVLGISFDSVEDNAAFAAKNQFKFPLLCDVDHKVGLAFGAASDLKARAPSRISFLIDERGVVAHAYDHVDPRNHAGQVLVDAIEG
jgi:thioredoxin-dependent peroxiredoxin